MYMTPSFENFVAFLRGFELGETVGIRRGPHYLVGFRRWLIETRGGSGRSWEACLQTALGREPTIEDFYVCFGDYLASIGTSLQAVPPVDLSTGLKRVVVSSDQGDRSIYATTISLVGNRAAKPIPELLLAAQDGHLPLARLSVEVRREILAVARAVDRDIVVTPLDGFPEASRVAVDLEEFVALVAGAIEV